jgi:LysR family transcriptional activator of mexEF-oprN operon
MVSFSGDLSGNIDVDLAKVGRSRRVVLGVPQFSGLRALLAGTEMIATVPDYAACALVEGCALRVEDPPFPIDAAQLSMAWSGVHDNDPAEKWLRSRISQFMSVTLDIPVA